jgi:hypothetical protein
MLYSKGIIHLQQDHSLIHDRRVVQECLSRQAEVELIDWTPRAPDMKPNENMWSEGQLLGLHKEICRYWYSNQHSLFPKVTASTRSTAWAT